MKFFEVLNPEDLDGIHAATMEVLGRTGMLIQDAGARERLEAAGCGLRGERITFPADLVARAIESSPAEFSLCGRKPEHDCPLVPGRFYTVSTTGSPFVIDHETGERRHALVKDVADLTRLVDALPNTHMASPATPKDVEPEIVTPVRVATMLRNTTKPVRVAVESGDEVRYSLKVAAAVHGDMEALRARPQVQISVSPLSPLTLSGDSTRALVEAASAGVPLGVIPAPIVGATGPMSLAGSLVQQNAEILAGLVLAQVVNPGAPVIYEPRLTVMDMRTGQSIWGNPEIALTAVASAQMARYYKIPGSVTAFGSSARAMDDQNGFERALTLLPAAQSGANVLASLGAGDNVIHTSAELIVLDDEIMAWVTRFMRGIGVGEEAFGVAAIHEAVMGEGSFLALDHTRKYMRAGEVWSPRLSDRRNYSDWDRDGRPTMQQHARARVTEILATHVVAPLSDDIEREIDEVIAEARADLSAV